MTLESKAKLVDPLSKETALALDRHWTEETGIPSRLKFFEYHDTGGTFLTSKQHGTKST
jgi:hypothetical protein